MIQLSTAPRTGLIKRHILMSLTFVPSVRRAMNQKLKAKTEMKTSTPRLA